MQNREFNKIIQDVVYKYCFTGNKKGYYYENETMIIVINVQKSNYDNSFYINYGFWIKEIHEQNDRPVIEQCDIMGRFKNIISESGKDIFRLEEIKPNELVNCIDENVKKLLIPIMQKGIGEYFKMYPHAIYAAKLKLRNYLEQLKR